MGLMSKTDRIFVAGHKGLAGSAIVEILNRQGYTNIITKNRNELDLLSIEQVRRFYESERPDVVILAAAKVGGIYANNTFRADFIYENLQIQNNVIWLAHMFDVHRLIFLGSSCIYPKDCPQPIKEDYLLSGKLEYTNQPYAIAKIAGLELINSLRKQYNRDYFSVMPTNLFGINDNFHPENSHVLASLIRKFCEGKLLNQKEVSVWGDGSPLREFMYSTDLGDAICYLLSNITYDDIELSVIGSKGYSHINIGSGIEVSIKELAEKIASIVGFTGNICFNTDMPNGTYRKIMDSSIINKFGWKSELDFDICLRNVIKNYLKDMKKEI